MQSHVSHRFWKNPRFAVILVVLLGAADFCRAAPVRLVDEAPVSVKRVTPELVLVDFGRVAFGNLRLTPPAGETAKIAVHFGEALANGRINRKPPGTVRYKSTGIELAGDKALVVAPSADKRNTEQAGAGHPPAILTPPEWGVVLPFRWVEIEGWTGELKPEQIVRQSAFLTAWNDDAATFKCSDETLNRIWELCRYSIKATTFAGLYVDGDRERIPYEADSYLNQISHYATDNDVQMARDTFDHLMNHGTWPTEWAFHMIFMAHADYLQTGDTRWLADRYESLKPKLLDGRARGDGLLVSTSAQMRKDDIVDWPQGERDGYVFKPVNTVVNAFHIRSLGMMAELAVALGKGTEATEYGNREKKARDALNRILLDKEKGAYRDGEGADHFSQHASLFPLAFGLVPGDERKAVAAWVAGRGMACSVYAAQYLMEGLFENGSGKEALQLIIAPGDRSWKHMVESGTTITWEAWDQKYKPNQDWNHAWGAAPANLFPRYILGVRALAPGWSRAIIRPDPCGLKSAEGKIPTPLGPVEVRLHSETTFSIDIKLPAGMTAKVELPAAAASTGVFDGENLLSAKRIGSQWVLDDDISGSRKLEVR